MAGVPGLAFAQEVENAILASWDAGVTLEEGAPVTADYASKYSVTLTDGSVITPVALGDINDSDNNHLLCFNATVDDEPWAAGIAPMRLTFEAGFFTDPNEDGVNQGTAVNVTKPVTCSTMEPPVLEPSSGIGTCWGTSFSWLWLTGLFAPLQMFNNRHI